MLEWIRSLFKSAPEVHDHPIPPTPRNGMSFLKRWNYTLYEHVRCSEPELEGRLEQIDFNRSGAKFDVLACMNDYTGLGEPCSAPIRESLQRFHAALLAKQNDTESACYTIQA